MDQNLSQAFFFFFFIINLSRKCPLKLLDKCLGLLMKKELFILDKRCLRARPSNVIQILKSFYQRLLKSIFCCLDGLQKKSNHVVL